MRDPETVLQAAQDFLEGWETQLPAISAHGAVAWRRDGLGALHNRLEELKMADARLTLLLEQAHSHLGRARALTLAFEDEMDRTMAGDQFEGRVTMMANRGMAADERALAHRMRASTPWGWKRVLERTGTELAEVVQALRAVSYRVRDERLDIRAQLRGIQVGIEIGEL